MDPRHRGPDWMKISPVAGFLFHEKEHASIRHRRRKPPAHSEPALRFAQQQKTAVRRLTAAGKLDCEFLTPNRWKVERKQRIVAHGGCGAGLIQIAIRSNTDLLPESLVSCHSRRSIPLRRE